MLLLIVESVTLYCIVSVYYLECIQLYSLCMFSSVDGNILFNKIDDFFDRKLVLSRI